MRWGSEVGGVLPHVAVDEVWSGGVGGGSGSSSLTSSRAIPGGTSGERESLSLHWRLLGSGSRMFGGQGLSQSKCTTRHFHRICNC